MNREEEIDLPLSKIVAFNVKMGFSHDPDDAEKTIIRVLGRVKVIEYTDFFKLFSKSILRIALIDMLENIDKMASSSKELPMIIKIANYRRNLMMAGLDKESSVIKEKGKQIV